MIVRIIYLLKTIVEKTKIDEIIAILGIGATIISFINNKITKKYRDYDY